MNLLMILLIVLAIWICAAICFFAWRLMPDVQSGQPLQSDRAPKAQTPADEGDDS